MQHVDHRIVLIDAEFVVADGFEPFLPEVVLNLNDRAMLHEIIGREILLANSRKPSTFSNSRLEMRLNPMLQSEYCRRSIVFLSSICILEWRESLRIASTSSSMTLSSPSRTCKKVPLHEQHPRHAATCVVLPALLQETEQVLAGHGVRCGTEVRNLNHYLSNLRGRPR